MRTAMIIPICSSTVSDRGTGDESRATDKRERDTRFRGESESVLVNRWARGYAGP